MPRKENREKGEAVINIANCSFRASDTVRRSVRPHFPIMIDFGSLNIPGKVILIGKPELKAGESGYIQLRFEGDKSFNRGTDFKLYDKSGDEFLGEGVILLAIAPLLKTAKIDLTAELLRSLENDDNKGALRCLLRLYHPYGSAASHICRAMGIAANDLKEMLKDIEGIFAIPLTQDDLLMDEKDIEIWAGRILTLLKEFHISEPHIIGPDLQYVEHNLKPKPASGVAKTVVEKLKADGQVIDEDGSYRMHDFTPKPEDHLEAIKGDAFRYYDDAGYSPPRLREAANALKQPEKRLLGILMYLCKKGYLARLDRDTFITKRLFEGARDAALAMIKKHGYIELADFRDAVGCSRRIALSLLERFDKKGWTEREGDTRKAGPKVPNS